MVRVKGDKRKASESIMDENTQTEQGNSEQNESNQDREAMEFDVVVVGGGPAGLATAIRVKQINPDASVVLLEKGPEVGAHILSGAVVDPIGIDRLIPEWRQEQDHPFGVPVKKDKFYLLTKNSKMPLPTFAMPRLMNNHGNFIVSLGNVCRWLAQKAEAMGVEIFPGFAAVEPVYDESGAIKGVATGDMGINKQGEKGPNFERGVELHGKYIVLAEGARGSLTKEVSKKFNLNQDANVQKFGIGFKELWEVEPNKHKEGTVLHTLGWPLKNNQDGGSFIYHSENNQVAVGYVVALGYKNPWMSPFMEFQKFKTHPIINNLLKGGKRISYGARVINQGGWQSVPKLSFPGGMLVGCAAGFVNVPRIKGSHNAILSGIIAAEHITKALSEGRANDEIKEYEEQWRESEVGKDLRLVRNVKPLIAKYGTIVGMMLGAVDMYCTSWLGNWSPFGTMKHQKADFETTEPAKNHKPIEYPKPDGSLIFDRASSVFLSNTNHAEDQPSHLKLADEQLQKDSEFNQFAGLSRLYCPVGVYEWVDQKGDAVVPGTPGAEDARFVINAQNCIHCKTCDIKDPNQNITWTPPQGGEGPVYPNM